MACWNQSGLEWLSQSQLQSEYGGEIYCNNENTFIGWYFSFTVVQHKVYLGLIQFLTHF